MFVLAHGSLAARAAPGAPLVRARGLGRAWGVGMENTRDLPGYRYFVDSRDGSRPDVVVAFADLVPIPGAGSIAVCLAVDAAMLAALDTRERNYDRVDVTGRLVGAEAERAGATVWAYLGNAAGRGRLRDAVAAGRAVAGRAYRDGIVAAYAGRGVDVAGELGGLPLLDLAEHPVPPSR